MGETSCITKPSTAPLISRLCDCLFKGLTIICNLCLVGIIVIIFLNVILRYIFKQPLFWGDELIISLMITMAFASFGYVLVEGGHVRMTIVFDKLPHKVRNVMWIWVTLIGTLYSLVLVYSLTELALDTMRIGSTNITTGWKIANWQIVMAVSLFFLLLAFVTLLITRIGIALGLKKDIEFKEKEEVL